MRLTNGYVGLDVLSNVRPVLMGMATVMILYCHSGYWCKEMPSMLKSFLMMGYLGVDIFLFISGIGMYFSWNKKNEERKSIMHWYTKRYVRVLVPYLFICIPIYGILLWLDQSSLSTFICNVTTLSYWLYHKGAWYVAMLMPLYFLTPLLIKYLSGQYGWWYFIILTSICYFCALFLAYYPPEPNGLVHNIAFVVYRLPTYFLGIALAPYIYRSVKIKKNAIIIISILCLLAMCVLYMVNMPFEMFATIIIIVISCYIFSLPDPLIVNCRKVFTKLGKVSLESYLFNIFLPLLLIRIDWDFILYPGINEGNYVMYATTIILGLFLSFSCNWLTKKTMYQCV